MWGFERQVWNWGVGLSDRVFRCFALLALFHTAIAPITYWVWTTQFGFFLAESVEIDPDSGEFVLEMGRPNVSRNEPADQLGRSRIPGIQRCIGSEWSS